MAEHLKLGITEGVTRLVEKARSVGREFDEDKIDVKTKKSKVIEWALQNAATRVVLSRNIDDLSTQLTGIESSLSGGKDAAEVDALRVAVVLKVGELVASNESSTIQESIAEYIKQGDVRGAVQSLRELAKKDKYKMEDVKKKEVEVLLDGVEKLDEEKSLDEKKLEPLIERVERVGDKMVENSGRELVAINNKSSSIEVGVARKNVEAEATNKPASTAKYDGKVEVKKENINKLRDRAEKVIDEKDKESKDDKKYVNKLLEAGSRGFGEVDTEGNFVIEMGKLEHQDAKLAYARVSVVLGRYKSILSGDENAGLREYLEKVQSELRGRLHEIEGEIHDKKVAESMMPKDDLWEQLPTQEKTKITANFEFMKRYGNADALSRYARQEGLTQSKTEHHIKKLILEKPELRDKFKFTDKGIFWTGEAEDFFELCRQEIYRIKDSVPEEQLGQLMFVDEAQRYLALMGVNAKNNPEIRQMKDAVTKMLYMEFALKSLWKAGGNFEAWQRAAGLLLRDEAGANFFTTMKVREKIRGVAKEGDKEWEISLPGFNVDDMLTIGELEAPNGQSWLAYISTDNMVLNERRLEEFAVALTFQAASKAELKGKLTDVDLRNIKLLDQGKVKLDREQMDWMRNYLHYMHVGTLNAGEKLWLMDGMPPGSKGFDYASLPGGQFAEKTGIWGLLYFAKYQVTKYGFEGLGKLFVPNHGLLSYARMETLRHFMSWDGNEAWLEDGDGSIANGGTGGARDFFFNRANLGDGTKNSFLSFWEETWLDGRTGKNKKTKGMRSLKNAREVGRDLIAQGRHKDFVDEMDFTELEKLVGYNIPGENNEEKLLWTVNNLDYEMMEMRTMPSKREGDLINKYVKYYTETDTALQTFLNAPTLANKMKLIDSIVRYNNSSAKDIAKMIDDFLEENRQTRMKLKEGGNPLNPLHYGPTVADDDQKHLIKSADGDFMEMPEVVRSVLNGWYPGRGFLWTRQEQKEGMRDPMVMRKLEIRNAIAWGIVSPQEGGKLMRDWQKMIYFGDAFKIKIGGKDFAFRPGMIPLLTPYFLARGWWVDKMGLSWEDFKTILGKQNEETLGKLMKLLGIG